MDAETPGQGAMNVSPEPTMPHWQGSYRGPQLRFTTDWLANELIKAFDAATDSPFVGEHTSTLEEMSAYPRERWRAVARRVIDLFGLTGAITGE